MSRQIAQVHCRSVHLDVIFVGRESCYRNDSLADSLHNSLAAVNFFLGVVGVIQITRIALYNSSQKRLTPSEQVKEAKENVEGVAKELKKDVVNAVKS
jgi:hypothetical protein